MQSKKGNYEKVLLSIMAVAALAVSGYLIWNSMNFADQLVIKQVTPKKDLGEIPLKDVQEATTRLKSVFNWVSPERVNKAVPLNKSILLVLKGDELFDLMVENPVFRPPMTNSYLVKNGLPNILSPNVGDLDPDGDGFSNLEEFEGKTNPKDAKDHPDFTKKLFLKQRITNDYILKLNSSTLPVQVQRLKPGKPVSVFVTPPQEFGFDKGVTRFQAESFTPKTVPDPRVGERDASELVVLDNATKEKFTLIKGEEKNLAEFEAVFVYLLGEVTEFQVKKGENFQIPGVGRTYKLVDIQEDSAVISTVDGDKLGPPMPIKRQ